MIRSLCIAALLCVTPARAEEALVAGVIDGDTVIISELCSRFDTKTFLRVRLFGIDTPESRTPPAKCEREVALGKEATAFARTLLKKGDTIDVIYKAKDKYACRIVGSVTLPDGRDMARVMVDSGYARPYGLDGSLRKKTWCD